MEKLLVWRRCVLPKKVWTGRFRLPSIFPRRRWSTFGEQSLAEALLKWNGSRDSKLSQKTTRTWPLSSTESLADTYLKVGTQIFRRLHQRMDRWPPASLQER